MPARWARRGVRDPRRRASPASTARAPKSASWRRTCRATATRSTGMRRRPTPPQPATAQPAASAGIENEFFHVEADAAGRHADGAPTSATAAYSAASTASSMAATAATSTTTASRSTETHRRPAGAPPTISAHAAAGVQALTSSRRTNCRPVSPPTARRAATATAAERIVSTITLTAGVPRIDIETVVFNAAEDHRLRAHFPSGVRTDVSKGDQHFGVVQRPIALAGVGPGDVDGSSRSARIRRRHSPASTTAPTA